MYLDSALERRLAILSPKYIQLYNRLLGVYEKTRRDFCSKHNNIEPDSFTHCLRLIKNTNYFIGEDIEDLNSVEIFSLLAAGFFYSSGKDSKYGKDFYDVDIDNISYSEYYNTTPIKNLSTIIDRLQYEFSTALFDNSQSILNEIDVELVNFIKHLCNGQNKSFLLKEENFPGSLTFSNGDVVHASYLASILHLADYIDFFTELAKQSKNLNQKFDDFVTQYIEALKIVYIIKIKRDSIDVLMQSIPKDNLGFKYLLQEMKDVLVSCKDFVFKTSDFRIKQGKIVAVDLRNLLTKIF